MGAQAVPGIEAEVLIYIHATRIGVAILGDGSQSRNRQVGAKFLIPLYGCILDWHPCWIGAELYAKLPNSCLVFEELRDAVAETVSTTGVFRVLTVKVLETFRDRYQLELAEEITVAQWHSSEIGFA